MLDQSFYRDCFINQKFLKTKFPDAVNPIEKLESIASEYE